MRLHALVGITVAAISLACGLIGCWGNNPVDPPDPEPKDYKVWIRTYDKSTLYAYHTETGVIDTVDLPFEMRGADITVSHDGELVYVPTGTSVMVLDADTHEIVTEIQYSPEHRSLIVSPDGEYVAIPGDTLLILNTSDYSLSFQTEDTRGVSCFSSDGQTLYAKEGSDYDGRICTIRLGATGWTLHYNEFPGIDGFYDVIPTPDESKLLLSSMVSWDASVFAVYDVDRDSIVAADYLSPGNTSQPAMTPDGRFAYYGNPGTILAGTPPPSEFTEFDVDANRVVKRISTIHAIDNETPSYMEVGAVAITPDGRWLIAMGGVGWGTGYMLKYDLVNEQFVDFHDFGTLTYGISTQLVR